MGRIGQHGHDLDLREIYPKVEFPVSRGTPMIAPLVKWNHSESHFVPYFDPYMRFHKRDLTINLYQQKFSSFSGHRIDGKELPNLNINELLKFTFSLGQTILPATGYVELVWETFAMMHGKDYNHFSVSFENIRFHRATILSTSRETDLTIDIQLGMKILIDNFQVH
jgi:fatty acid synthase, animal type